MIAVAQITADLFDLNRERGRPYPILAACEEIMQLFDCVAIEKFVVGMEIHSLKPNNPLPNFDRKWRRERDCRLKLVKRWDFSKRETLFHGAIRRRAKISRDSDSGSDVAEPLRTSAAIAIAACMGGGLRVGLVHAHRAEHAHCQGGEQ